MRRRLFTIAAALSLLLCAASLALWVRSYIGDGGGWQWTLAGKKYHLGMSEGGVGADFTTDPPGKLTITSYYDELGITLVSGRMGTSRFFHFAMPLWMSTTVFSLLPIFSATRWYWRRTRRIPGSCLTCGYNLTANTSGVCPECGSRVELGSAP